MSRILVVDDDSSSRLVLKSRLTEQGHTVAAAETGARGLAEARNALCDVFLVSASLGSGVDGFEVCRRLRGIPETNSVPVVLYHAQAPCADSLERAFAAGCDAFVSRAELPALEHVLRSLLRQRALVRDLAEQNRSLQEQLRRLEIERARAKAPEPQAKVPATSNGQSLRALRESPLREPPAGRPDGLMLVDSEGSVRHADRGAGDLLGSRLEGHNLGSLAPASGLEAFARDARIEPREGFRFDLAARKGHAARALSATVVPLVVRPGDHDPGLRVVLLYDAAKQRLAAEVMRTQEPGIPRRELGPLMEAARETFRPEALVGKSAAMQALRGAVARACQSTEPVLIRGDRGTGKERLARTLHYGGSSTGAYLQVRCSALTPEDLDIELFGHVRGAFPGALSDRPGLLHLAQDGTLHLDEIAEIPAGIQEKLLRFLETGTVARLGAPRAERLDVRLVGSTTAPVEGAVLEGRFRRDLYQRFEGLTLALAPLCDRREDIELLVRHYLQRFGAQRQVTDVAEEALGFLLDHDWPGNVAELVDCMEQACTRATGSTIRADDLPRALRDRRRELPEHDLVPVRRAPGAARVGTHTATVPEREIQPHPGQPGPAAHSAGSNRPLRDPHDPRPWDITDEDPVSLELYEKKALLRALHTVEGDKLAAARLLRVGKSTLYRKLKRFGID